MFSISWRTMRTVIPLVLLVMVLMRLVWMQLRDYPVRADYRALVTQTRLLDKMPEVCRLDGSRHDSEVVREFNEAKEIGGNPAYDWFLSPGYLVYARAGCQEGEYRPDNLVRLNQWLLVSIVAVGSLMVRMLTRSWVFALVGAVVLLSRGHLISLIGDIGPWAVLTLLVMTWTTCQLHFFLTGSPVTLVGGLLLVAIGSTFDPMFGAVGLVLPILLLGGMLVHRRLVLSVIQRFRAEQRRLKRLIRRGKLKVYDGSVLSALVLDFVEGFLGRQGSESALQYPTTLRRTRSLLFQTLKEPFALWVTQKKRWLQICVVLLPVSIGLLVASFMMQRYSPGLLKAPFNLLTAPTDLSIIWLHTFIEDVSELLDWHLTLSIALVVLCAVQSPAAGLKGVFELSWLVIVAYLVATVGAVVYDYFDFQVVRELETSFGVWSMMAWSRSPRVLIWFEPVFLVMGLVAIYHLLVIVNQRWADRRLRS